ncbi:MAG: HAD family phosphatase [Candidatus Omnitrophica bacterium]|nr:HAD family phosphatase [Candidatus Omnitrophota bacterium]
MIRALFFDLGNVLVKFDHRIAAQAIASRAKASPEELFRLFFDSPLVVAHDEGKISTEVFYEEVRKILQMDLSYERFLEIWNGIFSENEEVTALAKELLPRHPCFLISNTNRPHFEHCLQYYPFLGEFRNRILSYEVGVLKPHPAIYRRGLELCGAPPEEVLYIDDRSDLIEAARPLGFQVHRFTGAQPLARELKRRALLATGQRRA